MQTRISETFFAAVPATDPIDIDFSPEIADHIAAITKKFGGRRVRGQDRFVEFGNRRFLKTFAIADATGDEAQRFAGCFFALQDGIASGRLIDDFDGFFNQ